MSKAFIANLFEHSSIRPEAMMGTDNFAVVDKINSYLDGKYRWEWDTTGTYLGDEGRWEWDKHETGIRLTECLIESCAETHIEVPYVIPGTGVRVKSLGWQCFQYKEFKSITIPLGCRVKPHSFGGFKGVILLDRSSCIYADDGYNYSLEEFPLSHMECKNDYIALDYVGNVIKDYRLKDGESRKTRGTDVRLGM